MNVVIAIDPGSSKCGVVVARRAAGGIEVVDRRVVETSRLAEVVRESVAKYNPEAIIVGDGTTSSDAVRVVCGLGPAVTVVDEASTTLVARKRYFQRNPPRGLLRLIPVSLQTPRVPYDDYVAEILAERWFEQIRS